MGSTAKKRGMFILGVAICFGVAGLKPMFYGITIDTLVTLTALAVIWCMGLM